MFENEEIVAFFFAKKFSCPFHSMLHEEIIACMVWSCVAYHGATFGHPEEVAIVGGLVINVGMRKGCLQCKVDQLTSIYQTRRRNMVFVAGQISCFLPIQKKEFIVGYSFLVGNS